MEHIKYGDTLRQGTDKLNAAIDHANEAKDKSEQAVQIANTATENADAAAVVANQAAQEAITAANLANSEAANLDELKSDVVEATENANTSASNADEKAALAQNKVDELSGLNTDISNALSEVNTATANANTATNSANQAAQIAQSKSEFAEQQGNYAKQQGDAVQEIFDQGLVASVNNKTGAVILTAGDVGAETPEGAQNKADQAEDNANQYTDEQLIDFATKQELQTVDQTLMSHKADGATGAHKAKNIAVVDADNLFTSTDVEGALKELFTNANDGKTAVANAVTAKDVAASPADTFSTLATKIGQIPTGKKQFMGTGTLTTGRKATVTGLEFTPSYVMVWNTSTTTDSPTYSFGMASKLKEFPRGNGLTDYGYVGSLVGSTSRVNNLFTPVLTSNGFSIELESSSVGQGFKFIAFE